MQQITSTSQTSRSQLDHLRGPYLHSLPPIPAIVPDQPVPSLTDHGQTPSWAIQASTVNRSLSRTMRAGSHTRCDSVRSVLSVPGSIQSSGYGDTVTSGQEATITEDERRRKRAELNAKRPRYKHYKSNAELYKLMHKTAELLRVAFSTEAPFPDNEQEERIISVAFRQALRIFGHGDDWHTLTDADMKLFKTEDTEVRSRVRKQAVIRVPDAYGLVKNPAPEDVATNKARARFLLADSRFLYESLCTVLHNQDVDAKAGRFQHRLIREIIEEVWFSHANALGCLYQDRFKPIPNATIALVLTAIRHALTMYSETGRRSDKDFTAASFMIYDEYLNALEQFDDGEMGPLWLQHRKRMFKRALAYAGSQEEPVQEPVVSLATNDELARERDRLRMQLKRQRSVASASESPCSSDNEAPNGIQEARSSVGSANGDDKGYSTPQERQDAEEGPHLATVQCAPIPMNLKSPSPPSLSQTRLESGDPPTPRPTLMGSPRC
ncbi:hypothetical protein BN946_scf184403.g26 [Trametes cinnabarina]|uniref:DUF6532 domain-containing protein n=1 Tax=Pycnoporus cinnabarinus TaxID=5643 RepID=A0A060SS97_PYCCI|nr:hypothetical protein BN946_scf184403.g26 [Trametes cinnabarina]